LPRARSLRAACALAISHARARSTQAQGGISAGPKVTDEFKEEMKELYAKTGFKPSYTIVGPLLQMPIFVSFFFALRRMCVPQAPSTRCAPPSTTTLGLVTVWKSHAPNRRTKSN
jgi:hypothetical protein